MSTMFTLNLTAMASEVAGLDTSTVGWMIIAITLSITGVLWMAGGLLTGQRASKSMGLAPLSGSPQPLSGVK
ncbi:MAG TPA: hypothetical protein VLB68_24745 [Pyrinomonadaceae bacterium]|nr:hypothetical protein [Pyrinomonadaceae bacterium]